MSCPACFAGGVSASHPTGRDTTIHSLPTYISEPEKGVVPKGLIVFITDAFGWCANLLIILNDLQAKSAKGNLSTIVFYAITMPRKEGISSTVLIS